MTASFASQTLTFTKGDSSTFSVTIPDVSGSDLTQLNLFTQSQEIYNAGINSYTQSTDVTIGNIETYVTSSSQRIDLIEDFTASQEGLNGTFATTGSNTFVGDQDITGSLHLQDTVSEITLRNASGTGEVKITSGPDFITSFTPSTLTGIEQIGAYQISSSFGQAGGLTGGYGVQNSNLTPTTAGNVRLGHGTGSYSSFQSNGYNGTVIIRGNEITLHGSSSIDSGVSFTVNGDVSASNFTGSFVGDGSGLTGIIHPTGSFATTGSNTFIGNQDITGDILTDGITNLFVSDNSKNPLLVETQNGLKLKVSTKNEEDASGIAVEFYGNTFTDGFVSAQSLQAEPGDADTFPLEVTDGIAPRIIVNSQNEASSSGFNNLITGNTKIGSSDYSDQVNIVGGPVGILANGFSTFSTNNANLTANNQVFLRGASAGVLVSGSLIVSGNLEMAPNTAIVAQVIDAQEISTPTLLVDTIEGNSDTEIDLIGRLKLSTAGDGDARVEVNFNANTYSHLYGTTLEFFKNGAQGAKYTSSGPLSRITTAASLDPDGGMVLTGNSRAWSGLGIQPAVESKAGAGIFYATGSTSETLPLASIKPRNTYDNKIYIGNDVDSLVLTGSLVEVSGTMVGPVFEATSEAATPLLLVDSLEPNTDTKISISSAINLAAQDPLPTGAVGDLAVSGSNLYFYNGAWTQVV